MKRAVVVVAAALVAAFSFAQTKVGFDPGMTHPCFVRSSQDPPPLYPLPELAGHPNSNSGCPGYWIVAGSRQWGTKFETLDFDWRDQVDWHAFFYWNQLLATVPTTSTWSGSPDTTTWSNSNHGIVATLGLREDGTDPAPYTWAFFGGQELLSLDGDLWMQVTVYRGDPEAAKTGSGRIFVEIGFWGGAYNYEFEVEIAEHNMWVSPWTGSNMLCSAPNAYGFVGINYYCTQFGFTSIQWAKETTIYIPITRMIRAVSARYPPYFPEPPGGWATAMLQTYGIGIEIHGDYWTFANVSGLTLWQGVPPGAQSIPRRHLTSIKK